MLRLMRRWISEDPSARPWLVRLHHRGRNYAREQLFQVREALADAFRGELEDRVQSDRPVWARFDTETLLGAVLYASARLTAERATEGNAGDS